jgi:hypothetical protein
MMNEAGGGGRGKKRESTFQVAEFRHTVTATRETIMGSEKQLMCYSQYVDHWTARPIPFRLSGIAAARMWASDLVDPLVYKDSHNLKLIT